MEHFSSLWNLRKLVYFIVDSYIKNSHILTFCIFHGIIFSYNNDYVLRVMWMVAIGTPISTMWRVIMVTDVTVSMKKIKNYRWVVSKKNMVTKKIWQPKICGVLRDLWWLNVVMVTKNANGNQFFRNLSHRGNLLVLLMF